MAVAAADVRTVDQMVRLILDGGQPKYLGCLSQWWPSAFILDGQTYATATG
jgi:predicted NAD-dependent protein-ADP-ribosyltransferase YbiA (DUF1768 family)